LKHFGAGDTVTLALSADLSTAEAAGAGSDAIAGCANNRESMANIAIAIGLSILFIMSSLTAIFAISFKK
jgi:hypothetical protein